MVAILTRPPNKTIYIEIEDEDIDNANMLRERIKELFEPYNKGSESVFADVFWWSNGQHGIDYEKILEEINDTVYTDAYPYIDGGLDKFINDYLNADAQVLILMGEPGTGKTRLIRHIIKCMGKCFDKVSHEKEDFAYGTGDHSNESQIQVMYTIDSKVISSDKFFINFLTGEASCMVLEDIDLDLSARSNGNKNMHKLLAGSDGFLRNANKKLIISTNLKTTKDIDEALIRPGRCFGYVQTRALTYKEALKFLENFPGKKVDLTEGCMYTLSSLYQMINGKSGESIKVKKMGF